ncbi:MAG: energy transducer TonB [Novosphingobium sp.]
MLQWVVFAGMAAGSMGQPASALEYQQGEMFRPSVLTPAAPKLPGKAQPARPLANPGGWVSTRDYPSAALREMKEGVVRFRLGIGADGLVSDCEIVVSSGTAELDATTCMLVQQRARFSPALDRKGKPTTGIYQNSVRWIIPKKPAPPVAGVVERSLIVHADGSVTDCFEGRSEEIPPIITLKPITCPFTQATPVKDSLGNPLTRRVIVTNRTQVLPVD